MIRHRHHKSDNRGDVTTAKNSYGRPARSERKGVGTKTAFLVLLIARLLSAVYNIVHDCDEVYNYWEPLHFLLYGYGLQTWEYSSQYALRSYLYLLLHAPVAAFTAHFAGAESGKVVVFYATKAFLGIVSALVETSLFRATRDYASVPCSNYLLLLLVLSSGMFTAATSLLPSSFAMYMLTWAASGVLRGRPPQVVFAAVVCVIWGWPVAGVSLLPYALFVLMSKRLPRSLSTAAASLLMTLLPLVAADRLFYMKWTASLWNFIKYNVVGGGDSALYGVESPTYYLRNGVLNLNVALPLAFIAPPALLLWNVKSPGGVRWRLLVAISPVWAWLLAITALPHKEERFLYVVYPLVCLSAAAMLTALRPIIYRTASRFLSRPIAGGLALWTPYTAVALFALLSLSRGVSLVANYGAPMHIYRALPQVAAVEQKDTILVCVGDEWHRYPSSFFLPSPSYRLAFVKSGFGGLLPRAFSFQDGGTASASPYLNDRNQEEPANYLQDESACTYLVQLGSKDEALQRGWTVVASLPFMLATESRSFLARVLYVPWVSASRNVYEDYVLYSRQ